MRNLIGILFPGGSSKGNNGYICITNPNSMNTFERREGKTPNGGVYSIAYFFDKEKNMPKGGRLVY